MTSATQRLIDELSKIVDEHKYLILSGGMAVGKTFIASAIVGHCASPIYNAQGLLSPARDRYDIVTEFVPIHPSYSYEDFVASITINTSNGKIELRYMDKVYPYRQRLHSEQRNAACFWRHVQCYTWI